MPVIRACKPLRERCNVHLRVKTAIPHDVYDDYNLPSDPAASRRGRSTTRKPIAVQTLKKAPRQRSRFKSTNKDIPQLYPIHTPTTQGLLCLHRLVPYTYVGFYKGQHLPYSVLSADGSLFTHVIKIKYASGSWQASECDLQVDLKRNLLLLNLIIPAPVVSEDKAEKDQGDRTKTILTEHQLLVARDFLALALPYYAEAHPRLHASVYKSYSDSVRVLITAPEGEGTAADVMSVAACYLAWASEQPVGTVVDCIKTEEEVPIIWRDAMRGDEAVGRIGRVARYE